ncbi:hypothetical protein Acsp06_27830 [Actinomycetospora sp. NBRC 106375]|uniref:hypothetical protein n=1 Tax=Actinomycetospora sp. NBRC 106375 TaxID=3032207 RepID=UPI0024A432F5|nr:hypothetical protein [Actinomycetospora sp. NBRC 106375]GLZ46598.1 hypothetical protein Acsp06_27830 [Actinomycetospora sp. NBRC 106375]
MTFLRRSLTATALIGTGLACTTGAAFAHESHGGDSTEQHGVVNVSDVQTIVPVNACGNDVPVNVLGVQVPVQDVVGTVPILSPAKGDSKQDAGIDKSCTNGVGADN